jgi:hypothetical protein
LGIHAWPKQAAMKQRAIDKAKRQGARATSTSANGAVRAGDGAIGKSRRGVGDGESRGERRSGRRFEAESPMGSDEVASLAESVESILLERERTAKRRCSLDLESEVHALVAAFCRGFPGRCARCGLPGVIHQAESREMPAST